LREISIYIHIPFCLKKCKYCNFYSIEILNEKNYFDIFIDSLIKEIKIWFSKLNNLRIKSIYFGGGTPSIIHEKFYEKIFNEFNKFFDVSDVKEITIEANPETVEKLKFKELKKLGINRVSLGVQTFNDNFLYELGRVHNSKKIFEAMEILKSIYENINIDLIFGISGENLKILEDDLTKALYLEPKHISIYNLEFHKGTKLFDDLNIKKIYKWSEIKEKRGYLFIRNKLINNGFIHYEISNFSKDGFQSIHNLNYWLGGEYIGFGPSSYTFFKNTWYQNGNLHFYINSLDKNDLPFLKREILSNQKINKILFILNLRLLSGVDLNKYKDLDDKFYEKLNNLIKEGLIIKINNKIHLSIDGILVSNRIFSDLL